MPTESDPPLPLQPLALRWRSDASILQTHVNEASIAYIGDQIFLTLGEVQAPSAANAGAVLDQVVIREAAKIVLTEQAFLKILGLMQQVSRSIPEPKR